MDVIEPEPGVVPDHVNEALVRLQAAFDAIAASTVAVRAILDTAERAIAAVLHRLPNRSGDGH